MTTLKTLSIYDLASLLKRSVSTIRSDVTRRPHTLPPRLDIPGTKTVIWLQSDVEEWLRRLRDGKKTRPR